jgi:hypothetical protein
MRARALAWLLAALALTTACAPDAWRSDPGFDRWTDRVAQECYPRSIGGVQLSTLFNQSAFLDLTSRLYFRRIEVRQYTDSVDGFYPGDNRAAIECIVSRLPQTVSPR